MNAVDVLFLFAMACTFGVLVLGCVAAIFIGAVEITARIVVRVFFLPPPTSTGFEPSVLPVARVVRMNAGKPSPQLSGRTFPPHTPERPFVHTRINCACMKEYSADTARCKVTP